MEDLNQAKKLIKKRYRIIDILGQGGNAIAYQAEDINSSQQVALKAMSLRYLKDWKQLELFEREAEILKQLNHPNIPRYLDYFTIDTQEDHIFYIVQELVSGKSLAELIETGWRTNEKGVKQIAGQVLEILVYLHDLKPPVIHRDIKPHNLILDENGQIYLVDFGSVQETYETTLSGSSTIVGTFGYMSPEQFRGQSFPATDLYALGATLLFLLTHRSPAEIITENLKLNFRSHLQISDDFSYWLEKMLEPEIENRFTSAQEALEALTSKKFILGSHSPTAKRWRNWLKWGMAAVTIMSVANYFRYPILSFLELTPSEIYTAAESGNFQEVKDYLDKGISASGKGTFKGITPLHKAATKEIAELLIARGADVNAKDIHGFTPLHFARSPEIAKLLIAHGADVNADADDGMRRNSFEIDQYQLDRPAIWSAIAMDNIFYQTLGTPLHHTKSPEIASVLIANRANIYAKNWMGYLPIHSAAAIDNKKMVEFFLNQGVDVNIKTKTRKDNTDHNTPLHLAVSAYSKNLQELVKLLIAHGADINAKDKDGNTPLHKAVSRNYPEQKEVREVINFLISQGANINDKNNKNETPLLQAREEQIALDLIAQGADIHAIDNQGNTLLHKAANNNWQQLAKILIDKGLDINAKNKQGDTPLHLSSDYDPEINSLLVVYGADCNIKNNQGISSLNKCSSLVRDAVWNNLNLVKILIAQGVNINYTINYADYTEAASLKVTNVKNPLSYAGTEEIALFLVSHVQNGEIFKKDNQGNTLLHKAARNNWQQLAKILISKGLDINAKNKQGESPLSLAQKRGYKDMISLLKSSGATE